MTGRLAFDVSHLLAGGLVLISFMLLYQNRLYALLNVFALQAVVLALSVAWQAFVQGAPHLYITAAIALFSSDHHSRVAPSYHRAPRHSPRGRHRRRHRPDDACWNSACRSVHGGDAACH